MGVRQQVPGFKPRRLLPLSARDTQARTRPGTSAFWQSTLLAHTARAGAAEIALVSGAAGGEGKA